MIDLIVLYSSKIHNGKRDNKLNNIYYTVKGEKWIWIKLEFDKIPTTVTLTIEKRHLRPSEFDQYFVSAVLFTKLNINFILRHKITYSRSRFFLLFTKNNFAFLLER